MSKTSTPHQARLATPTKKSWPCQQTYQRRWVQPLLPLLISGGLIRSCFLKKNQSGERVNLKSENVLKQQMKHSTHFWVCVKVRNPPKSPKTEQVQRILIRYHWVVWFPNLETQPKNTRAPQISGSRSPEDGGGA